MKMILTFVFNIFVIKKLKFKRKVIQFLRKWGWMESMKKKIITRYTSKLALKIY